MTVTTSCYRCLKTIRVPLDLFNHAVIATCRDTGSHCTKPKVPR